MQIQFKWETLYCGITQLSHLSMMPVQLDTQEPLMARTLKKAVMKKSAIPKAKKGHFLYLSVRADTQINCRHQKINKVLNITAATGPGERGEIFSEINEEIFSKIIKYTFLGVYHLYYFRGNSLFLILVRSQTCVLLVGINR